MHTHIFRNDKHKGGALAMMDRGTFKLFSVCIASSRWARAVWFCSQGRVRGMACLLHVIARIFVRDFPRERRVSCVHRWQLRWRRYPPNICVMVEGGGEERSARVVRTSESVRSVARYAAGFCVKAEAGAVSIPSPAK